LETKKLLIIDDEENMRHMLQAMLERHGYRVTSAGDGREALGLIQKAMFDFVLCDIRMPNMDGMDFLKQGKEFLSESTLIMMSAFGSVDTALEAMKAGAYDFISKPFKTDEVLLTLKKAEEREQLKRENRELRYTLEKISAGLEPRAMVAASEQMQSLIALADRVSRYDTTVLITGESGTGKELIARGIHEKSTRRDKPFVAVNCGSIPENLVESELFGYVKGAFTGADKRKKGLFEEAHEATLFLDEIGELPLSVQVKLLRVLQEKEIRPVGSSNTINIDVRVLAATARDLDKDVRVGKFREDLFYRLNVMPISVPPLRNRKDDIAVLCHHFIKKYNSKFGCDIKGLSTEAQNLISDYHWPGNVRELENTIQRGMVFTQTEYIEVNHLSDSVSAINSNQHPEFSMDITDTNLSIKSAQKKLETKLIALALDRCSGNKSRAATMLAISYPSLLKKIKQYSL